MNKTLSLIVAASVLMMTALTVIYIAGDAIPGVKGDVDVSGCRSVVDTKCEDSSNQIQAPSACTDDSGEVTSDLASQVDGLNTDGTLDCSVY